jgi:uncharacterized protein
MRLALAAFALAAASLTATTPAAAIQTIDCQRDHSPAERTICASQRLQVLDAKITEAYADIILDGHVKGSVKQAVVESQINFLKRRDACGRDVDCLTEEMERRSMRIHHYR